MLSNFTSFNRVYELAINISHKYKVLIHYLGEQISDIIGNDADKQLQASRITKDEIALFIQFVSHYHSVSGYFDRACLMSADEGDDLNHARHRPREGRRVRALTTRT
jgi:hypothetical protein